MSAVPDVLAPLALPYRFGPSYVLFDRIGTGGMAEIYLAHGKTQIGATRLAVVKLVLPALAGDSHFAAMLVAEAKLAAQLSHANVVQTYDLGREDGRLYIAMEYVEGFDLNELLRRCSRSRLPLPADYALFIVGETLRALDYAHRRKDPSGKPLGIVHRDVSPSNVLVSFEGEVKLCDFGIARASSTVDMAEQAIEGKAGYMSPEHARGEAIDGRADVFAASVVLWELLAGRRLYRSSPDRDALTLAREADIPELPDRGLPEHDRLAAIVQRGLAVDVADRYPTAVAMARDLDDYVMRNRLVASPLRLGEFLTEHFGNDIVAARRARERAAAALQMGPLISIEVIETPPHSPSRPPDGNAVSSERAVPRRDPELASDAPVLAAPPPPGWSGSYPAPTLTHRRTPPPPAYAPLPSHPLTTPPPPNASPPLASTPAVKSHSRPPSTTRFVMRIVFGTLAIVIVAAGLGWLVAQH